MSAAADILLPGETLAGEYRVVEHVHRTRRFDIYRVRRDEDEGEYAAKTLNPHPEDGIDGWWALFREGRTLCSLSHPNLVRGIHFFIRLRPVLIMEYLRGRSLDEHLHQDGPLEVEEAAALSLDIASALAYLHDHRLLHLDLAPDNVVCQEGRGKLIDLSICRKPGPGVPERGKRAFMAPEQVKGVNVTPATDIWGLGALLFDCLTGRPPFDPCGGCRFEQLEHHAAPVGRFREVPEELDEFVYRCLEPDPTERPSLKDACRTLDHVLHVS